MILRQVLAFSRQAFAFSRDGALPFSRYLYRIHSYTKTPINAIWYVAFLAALLGLLVFAGPSASSALFSLGIIGCNIAYSIPIIAGLIYSRDTFQPGPFSLGRWSSPIAIIAIAYMSFINVILFFPASPNPTVTEMNYGIVVFGGVFLACIAWYYFPIYGGVHWFNGPIRNVDMGATNTEKRASEDSDEKKQDASTTEEVIAVQE